MGAQKCRNHARRANRHTLRGRMKNDVSESRRQPADEINQGKTHPSQFAFQRTAKNQQKQQIETQMRPIRVQKQRAKRRKQQMRLRLGKRQKFWFLRPFQVTRRKIALRAHAIKQRQIGLFEPPKQQLRAERQKVERNQKPRQMRRTARARQNFERNQRAQFKKWSNWRSVFGLCIVRSRAKCIGFPRYLEGIQSRISYQLTHCYFAFIL